METTKTIRYGDKLVPVLERPWKSDGGKSPYPETHNLKPGQHWTEGRTENQFSEHYVMLGENVIIYPDDLPRGVASIPVGAAIARELQSDGARWAVWTDCFSAGRFLSIMSPELICLERTGAIGELFNSFHRANGETWAGIPDTVAIFPDGRVAFRDGKRAKSDSLKETQHNFARVAERLLGARADFAIVEWAHRSRVPSQRISKA
jgi:hypothetical protein